MAHAATRERGTRVPPSRPGSRTGRVVRVVSALRPVVFTLAAAVVVAVVAVPDHPPLGPLTEYALRAATATVALAAVAVLWWSQRRGGTWGADLAPALIGAIAGSTLAVSLTGTPFPPGGLANDQSFRTAAITRFADSWHLADFTSASLPSFYAPAYFWVLGRFADVAGIEAWRMGKIGTVAVTLLVPMVTYLLWRRLVPVHVAALIAVVPLVVQSFYQPYAWLVLFAIVPWWLEAVHGLRRAGRSPGSPVLLGLVGALLFLTYYYFFLIAAIALVLHLVTERALGRLDRRQVVRAALVLAVAAAGSAVYWLPLLVSMVRAEHARSLANRWFSASHPDLPLPMTGASVLGLLALLGLGYLVATARRDPLSRGLLVLLAAAYAWYLLGAATAMLDTPLLSFRGKPLVPLILFVGAVLGLVRLAQTAAERVGPVGRDAVALEAGDGTPGAPRSGMALDDKALGTPRPSLAAADVRRVAWVLAAVLVVYAGQQFVSTVTDSPLVAQAQSEALPDGGLPPHHAADAEVPEPPAADLRAVIDGLVGGEADPVLLSNRVDLMALYPYSGFLSWNAHYAHPASQFDQRAAFLRSLAGADDPAALAGGARDNPYQPIDAFVLSAEGDNLVFRFAADAFPDGIRTEEIRFPRALFTDELFEVVEAGDHVVAVPR